LADANLGAVSSQGACAVCGRTFLVGEQVHSFVSVEGRHEVCELCAGSTAELGWLPAEQEGAEETLRADRERKPGLFARIFARPRRVEGEEGDAEEMPPPAPDATPIANHELDTERYDVEAEWEETEVAPESAPAPASAPAPESLPAPASAPAPESLPALASLPELEAEPGPEPETTAEHEPDPESEPEPDPESELPPPPTATEPKPLPDPAGRGMRPRRLQPDLSPTSRFERAVARFNASEAGRTVAGLTRTLGAPSVSVGDLAGAADEVRVTVAWELTWYQWGVDLGDELRPVYELSKGFEVDEIDAAARQWNASAHDGRVVMIAPSRREAVDGRPVHR